MNQIAITFTLFLLWTINIATSQEVSEKAITFNDNKKVVHGVYGGLSMHYGTIKNKDTYGSSFKVAYVANKQFEIGFIGTGFYADLNTRGVSNSDNDLVVVYGGLHIEPIVFHQSKVNLSFPLLIGAGAVGLLEERIYNDYVIKDEAWEAVFVIEPGVNVLYSINRYAQLEAGFKHRFSSNIDFENSTISRINGFSVGVGVKIGVFDIGRNK